MSNNNPEYIAVYFVECMRKIGGGLPSKIIVSQCLFACVEPVCVKWNNNNAHGPLAMVMFALVYTQL